MATATLFASADRSGTSSQVGVGPPDTMRFASHADLGGLVSDVSSVRLQAGDDHDGVVVLFDSLGGPYMPAYMGADLHTGANGALGEFMGNYLQYTEVRSDGDTLTDHALQPTWNNRPTSAMVARVNECREVRWHTGLILKPLLDVLLQGISGGSGGAMLAQPVEITWLPLPTGIAGLRGDRVYLVIHLPFLLDLSMVALGFGGVLQRQCAINAYVDVYPQQDGRIRVDVVKTDAVVWTGPMGDITNPPIERALELARGPIELALQTAALLLTGLFPVYADEVYFLPGNQMAPSPTDDLTSLHGNVQTDGITMVLKQCDIQAADSVGADAEQTIETLTNYLIGAFQALFMGLPGGIFVASGPVVVEGDFVMQIGATAEQMRQAAEGAGQPPVAAGQPAPPRIDTDSWQENRYGQVAGCCCCVCASVSDEPNRAPATVATSDTPGSSINPQPSLLIGAKAPVGVAVSNRTRGPRLGRGRPGSGLRR